MQVSSYKSACQTAGMNFSGHLPPNNNEKNRPGGSSPGATMRERTDMQTINQPGEPARENRGTGSGERGAGSLRYDDSLGRWFIGNRELQRGDCFDLLSFRDELPPLPVRIEYSEEVIGGWILFSPYGSILPSARRTNPSITRA